MHLLVHKNFNKKYKALSPKIKKQADMRLQAFLKDPYDPLLNNHALHGNFAGYRSINITGNVRALYRAINSETVEFVNIDTHSNLYR